MSILATASTGTANATAPTRPHAHIWCRISAILSEDVAVLTNRGLLTWMPAHGSMATIGHAVKSDGNLVSALDWRANRLADGLAKDAAGSHPVGRRSLQELAVAQDLVRHECAVLGAATYASNHHEIIVTSSDGRQCKRTIRDSAARKRQGDQRRDNASASSAPAASGSPPPVQPTEPTSVATRGPSVVPPRVRPREVGRRFALRHSAACQRSTIAAQQTWRAATSSDDCRPCSAPPAADRLASVRARVAARAAATVAPDA